MAFTNCLLTFVSSVLVLHCCIFIFTTNILKTEASHLAKQQSQGSQLEDEFEWVKVNDSIDTKIDKHEKQIKQLETAFLEFKTQQQIQLKLISNISAELKLETPIRTKSLEEGLTREIAENERLREKVFLLETTITELNKKKQQPIMDSIAKSNQQNNHDLMEQIKALQGQIAILSALLKQQNECNHNDWLSTFNSTIKATLQALLPVYHVNFQAESLKTNGYYRYELRMSSRYSGPPNTYTALINDDTTQGAGTERQTLQWIEANFWAPVPIHSVDLAGPSGMAGGGWSADNVNGRLLQYQDMYSSEWKDIMQISGIKNGQITTLSMPFRIVTNAIRIFSKGTNYAATGVLRIR